MITKIILSIADKIVVHNKLIHNYTISLFKIKNKKIEIIPHGTNLTIKNIKIEKANQLNLLYLGFLRPTRNITCIIKALDILQKDFPATIKLYLLFFIPKERHSNKQISEMLSSLINISKNKSNIIILIDPKEEVIDQILNKIHIGILPYHETTLESSGVAWRYAGLGIPFIGTNVPKLLGDFKFLDKHFLFSTFSPDKIAQAIKNLFYDKELYDKISKQLICIAINRSWDKIAKEYLRLYSEVSSHEGNSNNNTL
jgi:glycosyltransferase involved in cell wall biosynthesis